MRLVEFTMIQGVREDDLEQEQVVTNPVTVNVEHVREFYPRKGNKPGTRLSFSNSAGMVVTESYEEVKSKLLPN